MNYVRQQKSDTWHWTLSCQHMRGWIKRRLLRLITGPNGGKAVAVQVTDRRLVSVSQKKRPQDGELCNECLAKEEKLETARKKWAAHKVPQ